jgi:hypothetical protein
MVVALVNSEDYFEIIFYVFITNIWIWFLGFVQGHFDDVEKPSLLPSKAPREHKELVC